MRKKILSVASNDALRVTRHMMLQSRGFEVVSTANIRETHNVLKSADFDLVILGVAIEGGQKREMANLTRKHCDRAEILELVASALKSAMRTIISSAPSLKRSTTPFDAFSTARKCRSRHRTSHASSQSPVPRPGPSLLPCLVRGREGVAAEGDTWSGLPLIFQIPLPEC